MITPQVYEMTSTVVLTTKKHQSPRLCIDYRRVNRVIMKDKFPMPYTRYFGHIPNAYTCKKKKSLKG